MLWLGLEGCANTSAFCLIHLIPRPRSLRSPTSISASRPIKTFFASSPHPILLPPFPLSLPTRLVTLGRHSYPPTHTIFNFHHKYPNPYATHVHTVDTISRSIDPDTGIIRSERVIGVQQGAPRWITKVSGRGPGAKRARCEASGEPGQVDRWMVRRGAGKGEREGKGRGAGSVSRVGAAVRRGKGAGAGGREIPHSLGEERGDSRKHSAYRRLGSLRGRLALEEGWRDSWGDGSRVRPRRRSRCLEDKE